MTHSTQADARTWESRPVLAATLRLVAFVLPLAVSVAVGLTAARLLPPPESLLGRGVWWVVVLVASTAGLHGADRLARKLLPLATLMRLSMLFPDHAPSRLKVTRGIAGSKAIVAELQTHGHAGVGGDRQQAAETILTLVGALGDYDSRTRGHSERTQLFVTMLADELKLNKEDRGRLMWAALVHDIGKLKVPHEVLNKPGRPSADEWEVLQSHPHQGAVICEPLQQWLGEWWYAIEQHHEHYDGGGYPRGLAGSEISYGARIVSVADSYEVMTSARPYKRPMTAQAAREELTRHAGTQFDPDVVRAFLNISLGRMSRVSGPLAWLLQVVALRPGPIGSQVLGSVVSVVGAAGAVVGLQLGATAADDSAVRPERPASVAPAQSRSRQTPRPPLSSSHARTLPPSPSPSPSAVLPVLSPVAPTASPSVQPPVSPPATISDLRADEATTREDEPVEVDVLANDDGGSLTLVRVANPSLGTADVAAGVVRFRPDRDVHGEDLFRYYAVDAAGNERTGTITMVVLPANDSPTAVPVPLEADEAGPAVLVDLLAGADDVDGDTLDLTRVTRPAVRVGGTPGQRRGGLRAGRRRVGSHHLRLHRERPARQGDDRDRQRRRTSHGRRAAHHPGHPWVTEDSSGVRLRLQDNDTDPDGDVLAVSAVDGAQHGTFLPQDDGSWTYRPDPDFAGIERVDYTVVDPSGRTGTGTAVIRVDEVNDTPTARDDAVSVAEDAPATSIDVLANDTVAPDDGETLRSCRGR